ncbi:MAG: hypothetical protein V1754_07310 [Pseudomonadota bacterium]
MILRTLGGKKPRIRALLFVALFFAANTTLFSFWAPNVQAYVPSTGENNQQPVFWMGSNCVYVQPHSQGSDDIEDGSDIEAIQRSAQNWQSATRGCSFMRIIVHGPKNNAVPGFSKSGSNENVVFWHEQKCPEEKTSNEDEPCWEYDLNAAAITTVFYVDDPKSSDDGRILDADIEINGASFSFSTTGNKTKTDVENTVTHEMGHLLGLDHPCGDGARSPLPKDHNGDPIPSCTPRWGLPSGMVDTTMYNFADLGETKKRTPEEDDIQGICDTYPLAEDPGVCVEADLSNGGCDGCSTNHDASQFPSSWAWVGTQLLLAMLFGFFVLPIWKKF